MKNLAKRKNKTLYIGGRRDGPEEFTRVKEYLANDPRANNLIYIDPRDILIALEDKNITIAWAHARPEEIKTVYFAVSDVFKPILPVFALYAKRANIHLLDRETRRVFIPNNKIHQIALVALNGVPIPRTFFCLVEGMPRHLDKIENDLGYPMVAKNIFANEGDEAYLMKRREDFNGLSPDKYYVVQEFLENTFDYRILAARGKIVSAEKRIRKPGEFRNNVHRGAKEEFIHNLATLDPQLMRLAQKTARLFDIDIAGLDFLPSKNNYYFLEINNCPGFTANSPENREFNIFIKSLL